MTKGLCIKLCIPNAVFMVDFYATYNGRLFWTQWQKLQDQINDLRVGRVDTLITVRLILTNVWVTQFLL